jgi:hypothetical protein
MNLSTFSEIRSPPTEHKNSVLTLTSYFETIYKYLRGPGGEGGGLAATNMTENDLNVRKGVPVCYLR